MSGTVDSDVLMFFAETAGATAIAAESTSTLTPGDSLTSDFKPGFYFEIENFGLTMKLADDEGGNVMDANERRSYGRWRALTSADAKPTPPYRADPDDVSVSRFIDSSSPVLLKHCLDTKQFEQAVIVKRSRMGTASTLNTILRLDFQQVFIKALEWEDGNAVRETCKFKFGSVKATYVKRKQDSSVALTLNCSWTSKTVKTSRYDV